MPRRLLLLFALPPLLLLCGTIGYRVIEGWAWFDALYMTVITLTTVIPEPSAAMLFGVAGMLLTVRRRRIA